MYSAYRIYNLSILSSARKIKNAKKTFLWCSILELVRTHFSRKFPARARKFGKAAPARRSPACPAGRLGADGEPHR
ncbi:hypothetical protein COT82_02035 [Candidatus Campbellbacteria bacterium CG10_big_fil_rev_8_21_14_0_10_35_52]|uniref:Uncharacterized protein n=1 Tax=Candidatus Campbellbacteria bacterium CG10_big_fil_rev_8_21_14_0_10_35_52 TaxID=1974527 RepID=A0A2M6WV15_9BACT|nr:MAG: hypothetical protein COT82_02035 [Candidatus Campbellbacteria bacterium CG10_big_fil_rev_8_21_14_0_10_35_52]